MNPNQIILILSSAVLLSYIFDLIGKRLSLPSVTLLLLSGVGLRYAFPNTIDGIDFERQILPPLGTVGLILIVLEGTLELELNKEKLPVIKKSFWAAFYQLFFSVALIAILFVAVLQCSVLQALINATPFAVVSSAIAIPSSENLSPRRREFIIYESTFSDVLGIMLFNLLLNWANVGWWASVNFGRDLLLTVGLSVAACVLLALLLEHSRHRVKFLPIVSILLMTYAFAKMLHLSALVLVMMLGMLLNNANLFLRFDVANWFKKGGIERDLPQFKILVSEVTFVIRTFFFLLFGYSVQISELFDKQAFIYAGFILGAIFLVRIIYLWVSTRSVPSELSFFSPRGLITVLLFISIPDYIKLFGVNKVVLVIVVFVSALLLATGLLAGRRDKKNW